MSTLRATNIKNESSASNNIVLDVGGGVSVSGVTTVTAGSASAPSISFNDSNTGLYSPGADQLALSTGGTGRVFVDSSGRLLVNQTGVLSSVTTQKIEATGDIVINSASTGSGQEASLNLYHLVSDSTATRPGGRITSVAESTYTAGSAGTSDSALTFSTTLNATLSEKVRITSDGKLGLGTSSPNQLLHLSSSGPRILLTQTSANSNTFLDAASPGVLEFSADDNNVAASSSIRFRVDGPEKARIDSSGRLLVGTSSSAPSGTYSSAALIRTQGNSISSTSWGSINIARGQAATAPISTNSDIGAISFSDNTGQEFATVRCVADATSGSGDYPGRLVFSTTADGASSPGEAMRIYSSKNVLLSGCASDTFTVTNTSGAGTTNTLVIGRHSNTAGTTDGTISLLVYTNGNIQNTNNSYGAISDIKLKENIVDASSQWDDLKALQVRNYNFKEGQTHTQIGLIAQEVELVSPGLVSESPDRDAEGNDLGTVTKSVNYSVLYMKAVKALQEAMERIETLEAKVAALETP